MIETLPSRIQSEFSHVWNLAIFNKDRDVMLWAKKGPNFQVFKKYLFYFVRYFMFVSKNHNIFLKKNVKIFFFT